jgi:2-phosphoglycolate phosphatase
MAIDTVFFDLDGTLLDTAPDLAFAVNRVRVEEGLPELPLAVLRPGVSHGTRGLLAIAFDLTPEDEPFDALRQRLLAYYADNLAVHTTLLDGMETVLADLETRGLRWGVVTNKPGYLTDPLMAALGLTPRAAAIVSGDTAPHPKPHPAPLLHAADLAGAAPADCVYVGDAERDIQAGRAAGMATLAALFGYLADTDRPDEWGADGLLHAPSELLAWLGKG